MKKTMVGNTNERINYNDIKGIVKNSHQIDARINGIEGLTTDCKKVLSTMDNLKTAGERSNLQIAGIAFTLWSKKGEMFTEESRQFTSLNEFLTTVFPAWGKSYISKIVSVGKCFEVDSMGRTKLYDKLTGKDIALGTAYVIASTVDRKAGVNEARRDALNSLKKGGKFDGLTIYDSTRKFEERLKDAKTANNISDVSPDEVRDAIDAIRKLTANYKVASDVGEALDTIIKVLPKKFLPKAENK